MKINYPFKKYDWVNCSDRTEEEIQAMLERMWELGANKYETIYSFNREDTDSLGWCTFEDTYFTSAENYKEAPGVYNEVLWEDILPTVVTEDSGTVEAVGREESSEIPPVIEWMCFEQVAEVLGVEGAKHELNLVRLKEVEDSSLDLLVTESLINAFIWGITDQGFGFWRSIDEGRLPEGYTKQEEISSEPKSNPKSESIGTLLERIQYKTLPNSPELVITKKGEIILYGMDLEINVTEHDADSIDKVYQALYTLMNV